MKWDWLWRRDMWTPPDPSHTPEFHTFGEDIIDLGRFVLKCLAWIIGTALALGLTVIALVLAAWLFAAIVDALRPVPVWAWLIVIPLFGIWHRLSTKER
jgi:hypothetical protein